MQPNLFDYATSELSQDAILAWLIMWGDPKFETVDLPLHETGKFFIQKMLEKSLLTSQTWVDFPKIKAIKIEPQRFKIDLLVHLECHDSEKRFILLEDKIYSNEGNNQLNRYQEKLNRLGIPSNHILKIFLKTGFQPEWSAARNAGFTEFTALDLGDVWRFGNSKGVKNDIFHDFQIRLDALENSFGKDNDAFLNFEKLKIGEWTYWHWKGFFTNYKDALSAGFGDVPVARENLLAFWFGHIELPIPDIEKPLAPYLDVVWSDRRAAYISIRLDLKGQAGISRPVRDAIVQKILQKEVFKNGQLGKFKDARHSILLLNLPFDKGLYAEQFIQHLSLLRDELAKIEVKM